MLKPRHSNKEQAMSEIVDTSTAHRALRIIDGLWSKVRALEIELGEAKAELSLANDRIRELENEPLYKGPRPTMPPPMCEGERNIY
jgi:hypothetical protein